MIHMEAARAVPRVPDPEGLTCDAYYTLCETALRQNGYLLKDIESDKLRPGQYASLCIAAVECHPGALQWVRTGLFSKGEYGEICKAAFQREPSLLEQVFDWAGGFDPATAQDRRALQWVREDLCDAETYLSICLRAIAHSVEEMPFVNKRLWRDAAFCRSVIEINEFTEDYIKELCNE